MRISPTAPAVKTPPEWFTGDVWMESLDAPEADERPVVALVRFAPGARTAWHSHVHGQTVHVTAGRAIFQSRGGDPVVVHAGQTVSFGPGEEHWHGATQEGFMEHIAIHLNAHDPTDTTDWRAHVSEEEFAAAQP